MAEAAADSGSLSKKFNRVNHWRHILMDISMVGMVIGALVATGGASGFLDPVWGWIKMHFAGIPELFTGGPEFLGDAFTQASDGVWFTGAETNMHAMHGTGMEHVAQHTGGMETLTHHPGPAAHAPLDYSPAGHKQATEAADLWGVPEGDHSQLMLSHPE